MSGKCAYAIPAHNLASKKEFYKLLWLVHMVEHNGAQKINHAQDEQTQN